MMQVVRMTKRQRDMARHALGLPNRWQRSYRNFYVVVHGKRDHDRWRDMEEKGLADSAFRRTQRGVRFWLTPQGAALALDPGETLCPEDFPDPQQKDTPETTCPYVAAVLVWRRREVVSERARMQARIDALEAENMRLRAELKAGQDFWHEFGGHV